MVAGTVPIAIELGAGCAPLARLQRLEVFVERLAGEVDDMLARLGLPGRAVVSVVESDSSRALRIRVRGVLQPYPAGQLRRMWHVLAPIELHELAEEQGAHADAWFSEYVAGLADGFEHPDWTLAFELVQRAVRETLWERAGSLVGIDQADALLRGATLAADPPIEPSAMFEVLRGLVDLAVPVVARDRLIRTLERCAREGLSLEDTFEEALAALRPKRIEVLADAETLGALTGGGRLGASTSVHDPRVDPATRAEFLALEQALLLGRGVRLPGLELVPTTKLRAGMAAVRVNGRSSAFALDDRRPALDALMPRLAEELGRRAHLLVDVQETGCRLGQLQELFPSLVEAQIARLSLADLTRILRGLLREDLSIHDLKTICELLLEFDTVPADPQRYVVLDDRLPLAYRQGRGREDWRARLEFVRRGLAYQLSAAHSRGGRLDAIVVEPAAASGGHDGLGEAEQEALRDAVWSQLDLLRGVSTRPVVYAAGGGRWAIRELLAPEFPALPVLAAAEVRHGIEVCEIGRIRLPAPAP